MTGVQTCALPIYDPATPPANPEGKGVLSTKAHQEVARRVAEESIVLLKNKKLLPLGPSKLPFLVTYGVSSALSRRFADYSLKWISAAKCAQ